MAVARCLQGRSATTSVQEASWSSWPFKHSHLHAKRQNMRHSKSAHDLWLQCGKCCRCHGCGKKARSMSDNKNVEMALAHAPSLFDRFSVLGVPPLAPVPPHCKSSFHPARCHSLSHSGAFRLGDGKPTEGLGCRGALVRGAGHRQCSSQNGEKKQCHLTLQGFRARPRTQRTSAARALDIFKRSSPCTVSHAVRKSCAAHVSPTLG